MGRTMVSLTIPFTFAAEGKYQISLDKTIANIEITYIQNNKVLDEIIGIVSFGKTQLIPDDPEGMINISKIVIEFPFQHPSTIGDLYKDLKGVSPIKDLCVAYLNRLREVIRYCTRRYWIRSISPYHLNIYNIETYDDVGKGNKIFMLEPPSANTFPLLVKRKDEVESQISEMLRNETDVLLTDNLYLDSLNFFDFFSFSEAVITANITLEVFVWRYWLEGYISEGKNKDEADKIVSKLFKDGFQRAIRKKYFQTYDEESRQKHPIWMKLKNVRDTRKSVVHPYTRKPSAEEARQVLLDIPDIIQWILQQPTFANH